MEEKETAIGSPSSSDLKVFSQKILILLVFLGGAYILSLLSSILTIIFFSGFLTILFSPFLETMKSKKIPDWLGIIVIFFGILIFVFVALFAIIPIFIKQIILLASTVGSSISHIEALYRSGGINALGVPAFLGSYIDTVDFGTFFEYAQNNISSIS